MSKSLSLEYLSVGIALSCAFPVVSAKTATIPQFVAQKSSGEILLAQSVDEDSNVKFEYRGCRRIKPTQVTCDVLVTNLGEKRQGLRFGVYGSPTKAIDSSGTVHDAQRVQSGGSFADIDSSKSNGTACGCFSMDLASGIPMKVTFTFQIPPEVTELTALDVDFGWSKDNASMWGGKRIAISNIGAIAAQSNSTPPRQRVKK